MKENDDFFSASHSSSRHNFENKNMFAADLTLVTIAKTSQNYLMDEQNTTTEPNSLKNHRFSV